MKLKLCFYFVFFFGCWNFIDIIFFIIWLCIQLDLLFFEFLLFYFIFLVPSVTERQVKFSLFCFIFGFCRLDSLFLIVRIHYTRGLYLWSQSMRVTYHATINFLSFFLRCCCYFEVFRFYLYEVRRPNSRNSYHCHTSYWCCFQMKNWTTLLPIDMYSFYSFQKKTRCDWIVDFNIQMPTKAQF